MASQFFGYTSPVMVEYKVGAGRVDIQDVDLDELQFLNQMDKQFADQIQSDRYLQQCFSSYCGKEFWGPLSDGQISEACPRAATTLHYIIFAMKIRARFAIKQYERLWRMINLVQGTKAEKMEAMRRVNGQLKKSALILDGFKDHPDIASAIAELDALWQPPFGILQFGMVKKIPHDEDDGAVI